MAVPLVVTAIRAYGGNMTWLGPSASGLRIDTLIDIKGLCRRFRCSRVTIYRAVRDGQLNPTWVRGKQLFTPSEIERFIARGSAKARA